jgi:hypothetical protein
VSSLLIGIDSSKNLPKRITPLFLFTPNIVLYKLGGFDEDEEKERKRSLSPTKEKKL